MPEVKEVIAEVSKEPPLPLKTVVENTRKAKASAQEAAPMDVGEDFIPLQEWASACKANKYVVAALGARELGTNQPATWARLYEAMKSWDKKTPWETHKSKF